MYGAIDPVYMTMISWQLGRNYVAWDKSATIEFRKPGRTTLYATFLVPPEDLERIRNELEHVDKVERVFDIALVDESEVVHASFKKTIQVRKRRERLKS
jgi:hypothetical protein